MIWCYMLSRQIRFTDTKHNLEIISKHINTFCFGTIQVNMGNNNKFVVYSTRATVCNQSIPNVAKPSFLCHFCTT